VDTSAATPQIRNPNLEIRKKFEIRNSKHHAEAPVFVFFIRASNLFRISDFELRIFFSR